MEEDSKRQCSYCRSEKAWIWTGQKLKDGSKIYVDDDGHRWAGRRCPVCERSRVQAAVRCDSFEKDIILKQFVDKGYEIKSTTLPLQVAKDGKTLRVGIKRAFTENGKLILESPADDSADIIALVFESVRICTADQLEKLSPLLHQKPAAAGHDAEASAS